MDLLSIVLLTIPAMAIILVALVYISDRKNAAKKSR